MRFLLILFSLAALLLIAFNIRVTVLALRSSVHSSLQKSLQILLIWLLPLVGGIVTHQVHAGREWKRGKPFDGSDSGYNTGGDGSGFHF
jgi:hypothetical protein